MIQRDATGAFVIAGHRVPQLAVGVGLALVAMFVVLRARSRNANLVALGPQASLSDLSSPSYDPNSLSIADLSSSVAALQNEVDALSSSSSATQSPTLSPASGSQLQPLGTSTISPSTGDVRVLYASTGAAGTLAQRG